MKRDKSFYEEFDLESVDKSALLKYEDLAHGLAIWNKGFAMSDFAQDLEILGLKGDAVVRELVFGGKSGWEVTKAAQNLEVLKMLNEGGVALMLAKFSDTTGWAKTDAAQDPEVLGLREGRVALELAHWSHTNGWASTDAAQNFEVLSLCEGWVAWYLAVDSERNGWWSTPAAEKEEVLNLNGGGVRKALDKIASKGQKEAGFNI